MQLLMTAGLLAAAAIPALACDACQPSANDVVLTRNVRRMQPDAQSAHVQPKGPLEWGQVNFLHTTDTHGWLEGHLKEQNYGADWGDFSSFAKDMQNKARLYGRDLLLIDTGDLHDGNGLSDATTPNGAISNPIFENVPYDLLTIGNHELYVSAIAYETFNNFSKAYGEKYLTSNVQILNPATQQFEYIGHQYRYFTTEQGIRIMAFGFLFDFTGNTNLTRVIPAKNSTQQQWFKDAVNFTQPIDMFVVLGHNPVRGSGSTLTTVHDAIRSLRPRTPITVFGGHTHIRDFAVYDNSSVALESGRYCETIGWLAVDGLAKRPYAPLPPGVPYPSRPAVKSNSTTAISAATSTKAPTYGPPTALPGIFPNPSAGLLYARRYLDWNRLTMVYHSTFTNLTFDTTKGKDVTAEITQQRTALNLTKLYGCAPQTWCQSCAPFVSTGNIFSLVQKALAATVVNSTRSTVPRLIIINTGSIRFDLPEGPFTYDDSFIVSPFADAFQFIPNVPYSQAKTVLGTLNAGAYQKRDEADEPMLTRRDFGFQSLTDLSQDECVDPHYAYGATDLSSRSIAGGRVIRRQSTALTAGYTTTDDFGTDGDDTPHSKIPYYSQPNDVQANASFPASGTPDTVDLIFLDFIQSYVINALKKAGGTYSSKDVSYYLPQNFTTNSYLPAYAKIAPDWQKNVPNCPVGMGIGSS